MNFGEVLSKAWQIIWKYKVLWIFGILAGLGSGGGGGNGGGGSSYQYNGDSNGWGQNFGQNIPWYRVENWFAENWWIFILIALVGLVLFLALIVLGTFGRIGLTRGAWQADQGVEKLTFGQLFSESGKYFWRVLLLSILIFLLWLAVILLFTVPTAIFGVITAGIGLVCLGPLFLLLCCLLIPVGWAVTVLTEQAIVAIVNEDLGVTDGIKRAWEVFKANLGSYTVMFLILGIGRAVIGFLLALPAFLVAAPLIGGLITQSERVLMAGGIATLVLACIYIPIAIFLNGVITAYVGTAWTLTFRRLTGRGTPAAEVVDVAAPTPTLSGASAGEDASVEAPSI